ncbi:MAG: aquaporin [Planctomycetes bacterium]|nr:aquaporin [Planctomycetota bacterium]
MVNSLQLHWPEYLIEGALLGIFMIAACGATALFFHAGSPLARAIPDVGRRRVMVGILMGLTAVALIYSPWGRRSGAHMNPATTLTFLALGKVAPWDAAGYVVFQFIGGALGVLIARAVFGRPVSAVRFAATTPGRWGILPAFLGEFAIAFGMMVMVLASSNHVSTAPYTGVFAGALVAFYIAVEAPLSGMSMNPARTLASALPARAFRGVWVYFTAPPMAMLVSAGLYVAVAGAHGVYCAKMCHQGNARCIFHCNEPDMLNATRAARGGIQTRHDGAPRSPRSP